LDEFELLPKRVIPIESFKREISEHLLSSPILKFIRLKVKVPHNVFINDLVDFLEALNNTEGETTINDLDLIVDFRSFKVDLFRHNKELLPLASLLPKRVEILWPRSSY
jgi:hypothetical protein